MKIAILILVLCCVFGSIWAFSSFKLFKASSLSSKKIRYLHAISAFPVLLLLIALTVFVLVSYAPDLFAWVNEIRGKKLNTKIEGLLIMPIILPLPLFGYYIWYKIMLFLNNKQNT